MKSKFLFVCLLLLSVVNYSFAQITLEASDLPQAGDIIEITEVVYQGLDEGPSGPNVEWIFTGLTALNVSEVEYAELGGFSEAAQYANCESVYNSTVYDLVGVDMELVSAGLGDPDGLAFLNDQYNGHLFIEGLVTGDGVAGSPTSYINADVDVPIIHLTHLDYGESLEETSVAFVPASVNGISGVAKLIVFRSVEADAWGSVTTPLGSFDVVRHKEITEATAKGGIMINGNWTEVPGAIPDTTGYQETYYYMSKELHHPVLTVRKSLFPITVQYVGYASDANFEFSVGIEDTFESKTIRIYPNPTNDKLYFQSDDRISEVEIFNIEQRSILKKNVVSESIDVSMLENGLYFIQAIDQKGHLSHSQFVKQ